VIMPSSRAMDRYDALVTLLARPDLPCLPKRGRRYVYAGDPRRRERLKRDLAAAYLAYRRRDYVGDEGQIVCVRRTRLRVIRRAVM
jgi:hypothetical protein